MSLLAWLVLGLAAGYLAKFLMPGKAPPGLAMTMVLGIAGALVGGFVGTLLGFGDVTGFDIRSVLLAVGGAVLVLVIYGYVQKK